MEEHNHDWEDGLITSDDCPRCNRMLRFIDYCNQHPESAVSKAFEDLLRNYT